MEKSFNERSGVGDNRGYLDNYAEEVSYFDPILKELIVGRDKVIAHLESIYSNPHIVRRKHGWSSAGALIGRTVCAISGIERRSACRCRT